MIEAFWRSLKHQWLYLNSLDSIERLRALVKFFIEEHNTTDATFGLRRPDPGRDVLRHGGRPAGATGGGPEPGTGGAPCSKPGDDLQRVQWSASQPSRIANSSMISALTLLRTPLCERSAHTARPVLMNMNFLHLVVDRRAYLLPNDLRALAFLLLPEFGCELDSRIQTRCRS